MQRSDRWRALLDLVATGRVEIDAAATQLGVSPATIRRDLDELADQQLLVRTRGGAVAHSVSYHLPMRYRESRHLDEKRAIAAAISAQIAPGAVVGLNGGTTTTEVARALAQRAESGKDRLTVVTNAVNIAHELAVRPAIKLVLTGGVVRSQSYELVGPLVTPVLERIRLDVAVLGVDGVNVDAGATTSDEAEAAVNETMATQSEQVVVAADASKLGRKAFARICGIERVHRVVTGAGADRAEVDALRAAGVVVELA